MSMTQRQLIRMALSIRDRLGCLQRQYWQLTQNRLFGLDQSIQRLGTIRRKLTLCDIHDWYGAARRLLEQVESISRDIPLHLQDITRDLPRLNRAVPSLGDIYRDLQQIHTEFGDLLYQAEGDLLCVHTESIELSDVYLGEFEIQLKLDTLAEAQHGQVFKIIALDPHPASTDGGVTHPHVNDENPCLGEAVTPIHTALADGRICDALLLMRSVLTTYNPASPYVALDNWYGEPCYECGHSVGRDSLHWCSVCQRDFCDECSTCCEGCDDIICHGCICRCEACEESHCPGCLRECPECGRSICTSCNDEHLCPCQEERKDTDNEEANETKQDAATDQADAA